VIILHTHPHVQVENDLPWDIVDSLNNILEKIGLDDKPVRIPRSICSPQNKYKNCLVIFRICFTEEGNFRTLRRR